MSKEVSAESTPASLPLQASPITHSLVLDTSLPMPPETETQVPAPTRISITSKLSGSGKKQTFTATVFTHSGKTPTGTVTFKTGPKVFCAEAPLVDGSTSSKVNAREVGDIVTAIYGGDHDHATSSVEFGPITNTAKAETAAPNASGVSSTPIIHIDGNNQDPASGSATPENLNKETLLADEVTDLWNMVQTGLTVARSYRAEREKTREKLAERLNEYHMLLVRTGRNGQSMAFLRQASIPKSTAKRYLTKWKLSQMPKPVNRTTGTIQAPSNEDIAALVKTVKAKAKPVLTTPESVAQFLSEIATALQPPTTAA